nr:hypothetical protein GCM10020092_053840 [Actinoplanes digitatis]
MTGWTADRIPDQRGRVAVVTGANSGLGLVTATELARRGARVVLAVRNTAAGEDAARRIGGDVEVRELDLASLDSVRGFVAKLAVDHPAIDVLVNNAGVVLLGPRRVSADGFELQLATNMLGHFALTGLLLANLAAARESRVVSLSSITHRNAHLDFDDLMFERGYRATRAYGRSKLATTVFGIELDRRLRAAGSPIVSALAHPGLTRTNLTPRAWEHRGLARAVDRAGRPGGHPAGGAGRVGTVVRRDRARCAGRPVLRPVPAVGNAGPGHRGPDQPGGGRSGRRQTALGGGRGTDRRHLPLTERSPVVRLTPASPRCTPRRS